MRLLSSLAQSPFTVLTVVLALTEQTEAAKDLQKFFTSNGKVVKYFPNEGADHNGCKGHTDALKDSYSQAADMVDAAMSAISVLGSPIPKADDPDGIKKWQTKAETMFAFFGIKVDVTTGGPYPDDDDGKNAWNDIKKVFGLMQSGFQKDDVGFASRKPGLYCGTQAWKYLKPDDNDPDAPGKKISDKKQNGSPQFPKGVWHWNLNYKWGKNSEANPPNPNGHNICTQDRQLALTNPGLDIITWCDFVWTAIPATCTDSSKVAEGTFLDDKPLISMSRTWVHELAHYYGADKRQGLTEGLPDQPAVDVNGKLIPNTVVYGVTNVINYAKNKGIMARNTAEAYAVFAQAMYYSKYSWAEGTAKAI